MSAECLNGILSYLDARDSEHVEYNCNIDMFCEVMNWIKVCNQLPDNIDYCLYERKPQYGLTTNIKICNSLNYGGSEGIYLDLWLEQYLPTTRFEHGVLAGDPIHVNLGTIKTLDSSIESLEKMGKLLADFLYHGYKYVNDHYDAFDKTGYRVQAVCADGSVYPSAFLADSHEGAIKRIQDIFYYKNRQDQKNPFAIIKITDKRNGMVEEYSISEIEKTSVDGRLSLDVIKPVLGTVKHRGR